MSNPTPVTEAECTIIEKSLMNRQKLRITVWVFCWAAIPTSLLLWAVTYLWPNAPGVSASTNVVDEYRGMSLVMILGAIEGYIRWMHYMRVVVYDPDSIWQWFIDSALTPLKGAALAAVFCITFRAGLTVQTAQAGTGNVNWMGIYALAGITGLFSPDALTRLELTFNALFATDSRNGKSKGDGPKTEITRSP